MEALQRKTNASFAGSERDSPTRKVGSPNETFSGSKKGFIMNLFTKKKVPNDLELQSKPDEGDTRLKKQHKLKVINRKNIADGRVRLNVVDNDRVPEDFLIDYKDNPFDILDLNPTRTTSYIENLKSREFSQINNIEVRRFIESQQQQQEVAPPLGIENLELELHELSKSYDSFLGKFFRFFQGLLPGFLVIHLFLIFAGTADGLILESYVLPCLRVNQIFYIVALISVVGAAHKYINVKSKYQEAVRSNPMQKEGLSKQMFKYSFGLICFLIVYGIVVFTHEFVAKLSDKSGEIITVDFADTFKMFRILSVLAAILSSVGWLTLILAYEEDGKYQSDIVDYSQLTGDASMAEDV